MITLSKIFERERPLIYFFLWNQSDRDGLRRFTGQAIDHNLFIVQPKGQVGSVWYLLEELRKLEYVAVQKIIADPSISERMYEHSISEIRKLLPYARGEKQIGNAEELLWFFQTLTSYWNSMDTIYFRLPDRSDVPENFKTMIQALRAETQHHSDDLAICLVAGFESAFPKLKQYVSVVGPEDIQAISEGHAEKLMPILQARLEEGCFLLDGTVYLLPELEKRLGERGIVLESMYQTNVIEIRGTVAYKGIISGRVRIVRTNADLQKIQTGDIFVSAMTTPDHVSGITKAAALVTDEGGIMCHAAIIARELKIPCIIGTKIATQVLKDGDMIEVDAENGIVRKV